LGDGTFGRVYEVVSLRSGERYACKIIRAVSRYIKSAKIEAKILCDLKDVVHGVVRVKNFFRFRKSSRHPDQYCIIFEKLGKSLYQFLEENDYRGYHLKVIQQITRQVLHCLKDLKEKR
jgi:dual-specificity kinase